MKWTIVRWLATGCIVALVGGCAGPAALPSAEAPIAAPVASTSCPAEGSFVPFNKLMNAAFVSAYQGCNITTTATFLRTGGGATFGLEDNHIIITATVPGEQFPYNVALPKEGSDLAFLLKPGETILLRGGTYIPVLIPENVALPTAAIFEANSIARSR